MKTSQCMAHGNRKVVLYKRIRDSNFRKLSLVIGFEKRIRAHPEKRARESPTPPEAAPEFYSRKETIREKRTFQVRVIGKVRED